MQSDASSGSPSDLSARLGRKHRSLWWDFFERLIKTKPLGLIGGVVVLIIGTDEDPQNLAEQVGALRDAGAEVFEDVAAAFSHVAGRFGGGDRVAAGETSPGEPEPSAFEDVPEHAEADGDGVSLSALTGSFGLLNVGLETFYTSAVEQGASAVQLDWRPPAGGDARLMAILEKMR